MSIPVSIDPLGTLGANPLAGYVTDGLILAFDALLEPTGKRSYLTNWASGTRCEFSGDLTMNGASIVNEGKKGLVFNPYPQQQIDGHAAFGLEYSVDICVERSNGNASSAFNPWGENHAGEYYVPGFQILDSGADGFLRINKSDTNYWGIYTCYIERGERISAHLEFGPTKENYIRVNGASVTDDKGLAAGNPGSTATIAVGCILLAYRIYTRRLTIAEQMQNYAMDKKRFNLS